jgi:HSP20 family protein
MKNKSNRKEESAMTLIKYNPERSLISLPGTLNRFFKDFGIDWESSDRVWSPTVDVTEDENGYDLKAELPGLEKKDIQISVKDDLLTVSGERKHEKEKESARFHRIERVYGKFQRSFRLPEDAKSDEIKASYKNGVLNLHIPKTEEKKPVEITVN